MGSLSNPSYRIVAIPGEGIGPEVVEASLKILQQVAKRSGDPTGKNYLASPRTVAISAVKGKISHHLD